MENFADLQERRGKKERKMGKEKEKRMKIDKGRSEKLEIEEEKVWK